MGIEVHAVRITRSKHRVCIACAGDVCVCHTWQDSSQCGGTLLTGPLWFCMHYSLLQRKAAVAMSSNAARDELFDFDGSTDDAVSTGKPVKPTAIRACLSLSGNLVDTLPPHSWRMSGTELQCKRAQLVSGRLALPATDTATIMRMRI